MAFSRARASIPLLIDLPQTDSTNAVLHDRAASNSDLPAFATVVTLDQRGGRGRLGRTWIAEPGHCLAASVLLPAVPAEALPWIPLMAGLAVLRTVRGLGVVRAVVKWPNDVLVDERKLSGVLCELLADGRVVVGAGINLAQDGAAFARAGLDRDRVTSLSNEGVRVDADEVLASYAHELRRLWERVQRPGGVAELAGEVRGVCATIGRTVAVELPSGVRVDGMATAIGDDGTLTVRTDAGERRFAAGDVTHVRAGSR